MNAIYAPVQYVVDKVEKTITIRKRYREKLKTYTVTKGEIKSMDWIKLSYAVLRCAYSIAQEVKHVNKYEIRLNASNFEERIQQFCVSGISQFVREAEENLDRLRNELEETKQALKEALEKLQKGT